MINFKTHVYSPTRQFKKGTFTSGYNTRVNTMKPSVFSILNSDCLLLINHSHAIKFLLKPISVLLFCASSVTVQAAILSDNSEQRIQVRYGSDSESLTPNNKIYIKPSTPSKINNQAGVTMLSESRPTNWSGDSLQGLINQKESEFQLDAKLSIEENKRVRLSPSSSKYGTSYGDGYNNNAHSNYTYNNADFTTWLNSNSYRARQVAKFQQYLNARVGARNVPPLSQLLTTARSWDKCGYEPYQLPPEELWSSVVPTLLLYNELKNQGILPASSEIRSAYRSPGLNDCAGGANSSKHMSANAIDIWIPEYNDNLWRINNLQDSLCQFWQYQGQSYNFGLGLYSTGAIHLDTDGYRKWGFNHASSSSSCRY